MESEKNYAEYLNTLGEVIKEYAIESKEKRVESIGTNKEQFMSGYSDAFYRIVTLMQQHAELYNLTKSDIGLEIDEMDLL